MPTYTENVKGGVSTIVCNECGATVVNELRHEKEHLPHEPTIVPRPKMDTPTGLFAGACSCGWRSDGIRSEGEAWKDARQHAASFARPAGKPGE